MAVVPHRTFARRLRTLDPAELAAFVAAVQAARGCVTAHVDAVVAATDPAIRRAGRVPPRSNSVNEKRAPTDVGRVPSAFERESSGWKGL